MSIAIVTGSSGLVGSETVRFFSRKGFTVIGIDNDMRRYFFGPEASTRSVGEQLQETIATYRHYAMDIRDWEALERIFKEYNTDIAVIVHTAAQPSHDWAAREPLTDFHINATGTLNLLELCRQHCPQVVFIHLSTNKVYGDHPNRLPLIEEKTRWEVDPAHPFYRGIDESMSIDQCTHSLFGASKAAADLLVQEYGRYFGMKTGCFRGGCLTGPQHAGAELHGFLAYLMKCCLAQKTYTIYGYKGKQVRDNIHAADLVEALYLFYQNPRCGEVYNIGGGRQNSCSVIEAIALCEEITGKTLPVVYREQPRRGDHIWYISDLTKFKTHYPQWRQNYTLRRVLEEMAAGYIAQEERKM